MQNRAHIISRVMEIAEKNNDTILYAIAMMELAYQIVRSAKRRKLTITVERDRTSSFMPRKERPTKTSAGRGFQAPVDIREIAAPAKISGPPHPPGKEVVNGESAPYLGRDYRIEVAETAQRRDSSSRSVSWCPPRTGYRAQRCVRDWYIARAKEEHSARVEQHARELGVEFSKAKIVDNRYRWGSCTVKDNVNFNWRLIKAPMFVIDYVIVHELAHLIEANHTPASGISSEPKLRRRRKPSSGSGFTANSWKRMCEQMSPAADRV